MRLCHLPDYRVDGGGRGGGGRQAGRRWCTLAVGSAREMVYNNNVTATVNCIYHVYLMSLMMLAKLHDRH